MPSNLLETGDILVTGGGVESLPGILTLTRDRQIIQHRVGGQVVVVVGGRGAVFFSYINVEVNQHACHGSNQNNVREARVLWLSSPHTRARCGGETELVRCECGLLKLLAGVQLRARHGDAQKTRR